MSNPPTYADLEIQILKREPDGYPVRIILNGLQELGRGVLDPDRQPPPDAGGKALFAWLLAGDRLKAAWAEARGQGDGQRRIRLHIDPEAPELHTLPWESLRDPGDGDPAQDPAAADATPFSRFLPGRWLPGRPIQQRPVRGCCSVR